MFSKLNINCMLHLSQHLFAFENCLRELGSLLPLRISLRGSRFAVDNFKYGLSHWISPSNFWKLYKICKPSFLNQAARLLLDDRQHLASHRHLARQSSYLRLWLTIVFWAKVQLELCSSPSCQEWGPGGPGSLLPAVRGWGYRPHSPWISRLATNQGQHAGRHITTALRARCPQVCQLGCLRQAGHDIFCLARVEWQLCTLSSITWLLRSFSRGDSCASRTTIPASQDN